MPWFFVYKLPDSFKFAYKDSNDQSTTISISTQTLNTTHSPVAYTLNQIYHNKAGVTYLAWNDEFPSVYKSPKRAIGGILLMNFRFTRKVEAIPKEYLELLLQVASG